MEEKHICYLCGQQAKYLLKNGKWCCRENAHSCKAIKEKLSKKAKQKWKQMKDKGYHIRKDIPIEQQKLKNIDTGIEHICYYCGEHAEYQFKNGRWCCHKYSTQCPANCKKNAQTRRIQCYNGIGYNLKKYTRIGHPAWNKGLTAETSDIIKNAAYKVHLRYKNHQLIPPGTYTVQTKQRINKMMMTRMTNHSLRYYKNMRHGWYKGYWCDSSWQLAFVIYNLEHDIKFKRNTESFEYMFEDKKLLYYPDFIMQNGDIIQIKGRVTEKDKAKFLQYPNIIVLTKTQMTPYIKYAQDKYGRKFYQLLTKEQE